MSAGPRSPGRAWPGDRAARLRWLKAAAWTVLVLGVVAFLVQGANRPPDPSFAPAGKAGAPGGEASGRRPLEGFGEVAFRIASPGGAAADWCALLAADRQSVTTGLMDQRDLRGYEAMVFRYPRPVTGTFYMRDTLIPLSIAFFDAGGRFVSAADMEPCPDEIAECPQYPAEAPYTHAIEVAQGSLASLGIGPASVLSFPAGGCPPA